MLLRAMRYLGALALLGVGAVHLQQYIGADYQAIPTIGTLFLLNAIGSGVVGIALLLPLERPLGSRRADTAVGLLALAAVGIAVGSLIALFISEAGGLFGFTETGYRTAIVLAIVTEGLVCLLLGPVAAHSMARALRGGQRPTTAPRPARPSRRLMYD
jgi:hypothetical protein